MQRNTTAKEMRGEHRAKLPTVHTHLDFKNTGPNLSKGCSVAASEGPADVSLSLQIHHHISIAYMKEERANLIYLAVWALQSPKQTSPAASSLHCLPLPNVLSSLSSHLGWVQQRTWALCQKRGMCQRPFKIHFVWQEQERHESDGLESLPSLNLPVSPINWVLQSEKQL